MLGLREGFVRPWPGPARPDEADALFTGGWRAAAIDGIGNPRSWRPSPRPTGRPSKDSPPNGGRSPPTSASAKPSMRGRAASARRPR